CKTCDRSFPSFQALGGHRTTHKKAAPAPEEVAIVSLRNWRLHVCSICGVGFASGQALGGHMRRHRRPFK
ncbi:hypothetical protein M569_02805, partial [Genlisea aurea]